jgi:hypothetical protein
MPYKYNLPSQRHYANNKNNNSCVTIYDQDGYASTYYFSYNMLVAFFHVKSGMVCSQNYWGTTTGKHLNCIEPDHKKRVNEKLFREIYDTVFFDGEQPCQR